MENLQPHLKKKTQTVTLKQNNKKNEDMSDPIKAIVGQMKAAGKVPDENKIVTKLSDPAFRKSYFEKKGESLGYKSYDDFEAALAPKVKGINDFNRPLDERISRKPLESEKPFKPTFPPTPLTAKGQFEKEQAEREIRNNAPRFEGPSKEEKASAGRDQSFAQYIGLFGENKPKPIPFYEVPNEELLTNVRGLRQDIAELEAYKNDFDNAPDTQNIDQRKRQEVETQLAGKIDQLTRLKGENPNELPIEWMTPKELLERTDTPQRKQINELNEGAEQIDLLKKRGFATSEVQKTGLKQDPELYRYTAEAETYGLYLNELGRAANVTMSKVTEKFGYDIWDTLKKAQEDPNSLTGKERYSLEQLSANSDYQRLVDQWAFQEQWADRTVKLIDKYPSVRQTQKEGERQQRAIDAVVRDHPVLGFAGDFSKKLVKGTVVNFYKAMTSNAATEYEEFAKSGLGIPTDNPYFIATSTKFQKPFTTQIEEFTDLNGKKLVAHYTTDGSFIGTFDKEHGLRVSTIDPGLYTKESKTQKNWTSGAAMGTEVLGDMAVTIALTRGLTNAAVLLKPGAAAATATQRARIARWIATPIASTVQYNNRWVQQGLQEGMTIDQATSYSLAVSAGIGMLQTIYPFEAQVSEKLFANMWKGVTPKDVAKYLTNPSTFWKKVTLVGKDVLGENVEENIEQGFEMYGANRLANEAFGTDLQTQYKDWQELKETLQETGFITTFATGPLSALTQVTDKSLNQTMMRKYLLAAAMDLDQYKATISELRSQGKLDNSKNYYEEELDAIKSRHGEAFASEEYTDEAKKDLIVLELQSQMEAQKAASAQDPNSAVAQKARDRYDEIQEEIKNTLSSKKGRSERDLKQIKKDRDVRMQQQSEQQERRKEKKEADKQEAAAQAEAAIPRHQTILDRLGRKQRGEVEPVTTPEVEQTAQEQVEPEQPTYFVDAIGEEVVANNDNIGDKEVDKKDDIERRREEEFDQYSNELISKTELYEDGEGRKYLVHTLRNGKKRLDNANENGERTSTADVYDGSVPVENYITDAKKIKDVERKSSKQEDRINAKYDAELAALEQPKAEPSSRTQIGPNQFQENGEVFYEVPSSNGSDPTPVRLTDEKYQEWKDLDDKEKADRELVQKSKTRSPEQKSKRLKEIAMTSAAAKRKVLGTLTALEQRKADRELNTVQQGDSVMQGNVKFTVVNPSAYGKVQFRNEETGLVFTIDRDSEIVKDLITQKKAPKPASAPTTATSTATSVEFTGASNPANETTPFRKRAANAAKFLAKLGFPVKIVVHSTQQSFYIATKNGQSAGIYQDGVIHLDESAAIDGKELNTRAIHEAWHPVIDYIRSTNPELYTKLTKFMTDEVKKNPSLNKKLGAFAARYVKANAAAVAEGKEAEHDVEEESLTEFLTQVSDNPNILTANGRKSLAKAIAKTFKAFAKYFVATDNRNIDELGNEAIMDIINAAARAFSGDMTNTKALDNLITNATLADFTKRPEKILSLRNWAIVPGVQTGGEQILYNGAPATLFLNTPTAQASTLGTTVITPDGRMENGRVTPHAGITLNNPNTGLPTVQVGNTSISFVPQPISFRPKSSLLSNLREGGIKGLFTDNTEANQAKQLREVIEEQTERAQRHLEGAITRARDKYPTEQATLDILEAVTPTNLGPNKMTYLQHKDWRRTRWADTPVGAYFVDKITIADEQVEVIFDNTNTRSTQKRSIQIPINEITNKTPEEAAEVILQVVNQNPDLKTKGLDKITPRLKPAALKDFELGNVSSILYKDDWTIITAENPNSSTNLTKQENNIRNNELEAELRQMKSTEYPALEYEKVEGKWGSPENSFIVTGIPIKETIRLTGEYEQTGATTRFGIVNSDAEVNPARGLVNVSDTKPNDLYTAYNGAYFSLDIDFTTQVPLDLEQVYNPKAKSSLLPTEEATFPMAPTNTDQFANMTVDGGDFVFFHWSKAEREWIDPAYQGTGILPSDEARSIGTGAPTQMFYTEQGVTETGVGHVAHVVRVPMDQVYDFNNDPNNYFEEAKALHQKYNPGQAFGPNAQVAFITRVAADNGYLMTVAKWGQTSRAHTAVPLKVVESANTQEYKFVKSYPSNKSLGWRPLTMTTKDELLGKLYEKISSSVGADYSNPLYKLRSMAWYGFEDSFAPFKSQEAITEAIMNSELPQSVKDNYQETLGATEQASRAIYVAPAAVAKSSLLPFFMDEAEAEAIASTIEGAVVPGGVITTWKKVSGDISVEQVKSAAGVALISQAKDLAANTLIGIDIETPFIESVKGATKVAQKVVLDDVKASAKKLRQWAVDKKVAEQKKLKNKSLKPVARAAATKNLADAQSLIKQLPKINEATTIEELVNAIKEIGPQKQRQALLSQATLGYNVSVDAKGKTTIAKNTSVQDKEVRDKLIPLIIQKIKDNLKFVYDSIDPSIRAISKLWYDGANLIAQEWVNEYNISLEKVAAIIAIQSPTKDWFGNLHVSHAAIQILSDPNLVLTKEHVDFFVAKAKGYPEQAKYVPDLRKQVGTKLSDLSNFHAGVLLRAQFELYMDRIAPKRLPTGAVVGTTGKLASFNDYASLERLVDIYRAPADDKAAQLEIISSHLGDYNKVRNFYVNIVDPNDPKAVTIDTHAMAAGLFSGLSSASYEVEFGASNYAIFADAYRELAEEIGILPRELQSITWEGIRAIFSNSDKATKVIANRVNEFIPQRNRGEITAEEARIKIKNDVDANKTEWSEQLEEIRKPLQELDYLGRNPGVPLSGRGSSGQGDGSNAEGGVSTAGRGDRRIYGVGKSSLLPTQVLYTGVYVNKEQLLQSFPPVHENVYAHHSTAEFKPKTLDGLPIGEKKALKIKGRLITPKVDVLLVENDLSKNQYPHITLSTSGNTKPFESNEEIKNNLDKVVPLDVIINGTVGVTTKSGDVLRAPTQGKSSLLPDDTATPKYSLLPEQEDILRDEIPNIQALTTRDEKDGFIEGLANLWNVEPIDVLVGLANHRVFWTYGGKNLNQTAKRALLGHNIPVVAEMFYDMSNSTALQQQMAEYAEVAMGWGSPDAVDFLFEEVDELNSDPKTRSAAMHLLNGMLQASLSTRSGIQVQQRIVAKQKELSSSAGQVLEAVRSVHNVLPSLHKILHQLGYEQAQAAGATEAQINNIASATNEALAHNEEEVSQAVGMATRALKRDPHSKSMIDRALSAVRGIFSVFGGKSSLLNNFGANSTHTSQIEAVADFMTEMVNDGKTGAQTVYATLKALQQVNDEYHQGQGTYLFANNEAILEFFRAALGVRMMIPGTNRRGTTLVGTYLNQTSPYQVDLTDLADILNYNVTAEEILKRLVEYVYSTNNVGGKTLAEMIMGSPFFSNYTTREALQIQEVVASHMQKTYGERVKSEIEQYVQNMVQEQYFGKDTVKFKALMRSNVEKIIDAYNYGILADDSLKALVAAMYLGDQNLVDTVNRLIELSVARAKTTSSIAHRKIDKEGSWLAFKANPAVLAKFFVNLFAYLINGLLSGVTTLYAATFASLFVTAPRIGARTAYMAGSSLMDMFKGDWGISPFAFLVDFVKSGQMKELFKGIIPNLMRNDSRADHAGAFFGDSGLNTMGSIKTQSSIDRALSDGLTDLFASIKAVKNNPSLSTVGQAMLTTLSTVATAPLRVVSVLKAYEQAVASITVPYLAYTEALEQGRKQGLRSTELLEFARDKAGFGNIRAAHSAAMREMISMAAEPEFQHMFKLDAAGNPVISSSGMPVAKLRYADLFGSLVQDAMLRQADNDFTVLGEYIYKDMQMMGQPEGLRPATALMGVARVSKPNILQAPGKQTFGHTITAATTAAFGYALLPFGRIIAQTISVSYRYSVFGAIHTAIKLMAGNKETFIGKRVAETIPLPFLGKALDGMVDTRIRSNAELWEQFLITAGAMVVFFGYFAMDMFDWDDDELKLNPDRNWDFTFTLTGSYRKNLLQDPSAKTLSYRQRNDDGTWGEWHSYKFAMLHIPFASVLGSIRDKLTYGEDKLSAQEASYTLVSGPAMAITEQTFAMTINTMKNAAMEMTWGAKEEGDETAQAMGQILKTMTVDILARSMRTVASGGNFTRDIYADLTKAGYPGEGFTNSQVDNLSDEVLIAIFKDSPIFEKLILGDRDKVYDSFGNQVPREFKVKQLAEMFAQGMAGPIPLPLVNTPFGLSEVTKNMDLTPVEDEYMNLPEWKLISKYPRVSAPTKYKAPDSMQAAEKIVILKEDTKKELQMEVAHIIRDYVRENYDELNKMDETTLAKELKFISSDAVKVMKYRREYYQQGIRPEIGTLAEHAARMIGDEQKEILKQQRTVQEQ